MSARISTQRALPPDAPSRRPTTPVLPTPVREPQLGVLVQVAAGGDQARAVDGGESHTRELGHNWLITHTSHFGRRAMHTRRPCRISVCENQVHLSRGTSVIRSRSIFTGSLCFVRPSSVASR